MQFRPLIFFLLVSSFALCSCSTSSTPGNGDPSVECPDEMPEEGDPCNIDYWCDYYKEGCWGCGGYNYVSCECREERFHCSNISVSCPCEESDSGDLGDGDYGQDGGELRDGD